mmetsp:Transcript_49954/g.142804  ORF Transcript_49954/g.142804 Transcript_49954/m.142804 type:complete len:575 (-) Transcript_49954:92-1816(-)
MWARRGGLRPQWPSRIRVFAMSCSSITAGLVIYQYLSSMMVSDLDLTQPVHDEILCLAHWPLIYSSDGDKGWLDQGAWFNWSKALLNRDDFVRDSQCRFVSADRGPGSIAGKTCDALRVPIESMDQPLGLALGEGANVYYNILNGFAYVFLWLGVSLCYTLLWHDLCMCTIKYKDKVRDLRGVYEHYTGLLLLLLRVSGFETMRQLRRGDLGGKAGQVLCWVIAPVWLAWALPFFMLVWWPIAAVVFLTQPVALCRVAVFTNSVLFFVYALAATVLSLVMLFDGSHRPTYAVTFGTSDADSVCSCGCVYRLSWSKNLELFLVSLGATLQCLAKGWLCLKGLRNSNWATMLTVKFPVPLNMYPVQWTREDEDKDYISGKPIQHRDRYTPVQGEVAFDPFALMDEQPDSAKTWCQIRPSKASRPRLSRKGDESVTIQRQESTSSRAGTSSRGSSKNNKLAGPLATESGVRFAKTVEDQDFCCGFACVKFGKRGLDSDEEDDNDAPAAQASASVLSSLAPAETADRLVARLLQAPELASLTPEQRGDLQARLAPLLAREMGEPDAKAAADDDEVSSL